MSPILVTLMSRYGSNFERLNTSFSENKLDVVDLNSNRRDCGVRKNTGETLRFLADCILVISFQCLIGTGSSGQEKISGNLEHTVLLVVCQKVQ